MESSLIDVNIYCDESRYSNNEDPYLVIGAVKCLRDKKPEIANALIKMKRAYGIGGEFGWKTASRNKEDFYRAVLSWFINCDAWRAPSRPSSARILPQTFHTHRNANRKLAD